MAVDLGENPAVGHVAIHASFLEAEDGAVGRRAREDTDVAGFVEVRDAALLVEPGIELLGRSQFDEFARYDENQFAAWLQMADRLFDEEQEEVATGVEQFRFETFFRVDRNILKTYVGWIADDGVELLVQWVGKKIADLCAFWCNQRIDFDTGDIVAPLTQGVEKGAITG